MAKEIKARAFRWCGPGVLHLRVGDNVRVVPPEGKESLVKDSEQLEALGAARIAEMIKNGQAEYVGLVEGALNVAAPATPESEEEHKQAQETASESAQASAAVRKTAKAARAAREPQANAEVPALTAANPPPAREPEPSDAELEKLTAPGGAGPAGPAQE